MIRVGLIWSAVLIGVMVGITLLVQIGISGAEQVPIHWNAQGEVDGYASPAKAMIIYWILIGTAVGMVGLFAGLPLIQSMRDELEAIRSIYLGIWLGTLGLLVLIVGVIAWVTYQSVTPQSGLGSSGESPERIFTWLVRGILAAVSLGLVALGNYLPKVQQNRAIGIRTKWSLSDKDNWAQTHRFAGKVFFIAGGICFLTACFAPLLIGGLIWAAVVLLASVICYYYSYRLAR